MKEIVKQFCPPILWNILLKVNRSYFYKKRLISKSSNPDNQELEVYWDAKMSQILENMGRRKCMA